LLNQILLLFGEPPGSVVYHIIILFMVEAAFAIAVGQWLRDRQSATLRLTIATALLCVLRITVLIAAILAWQGFASRQTLIPPVERAVDTATLVVLAWLFVTMKKDALLQYDLFPDAAAGVALGMTVVGFLGSYYYWFFSVDAAQGFNNQIIDVAWMVAQIIVAMGGLGWMVTRLRSIYDPFLKGLILIVLGGAAALHLVNPVFGDVAAAVRLGQLVAMPMVAAMAYRHVVDQLLRWDSFIPLPAAVSQERTAVATPLPPVPDDAPTPVTPVDPPTPPEEALQQTMKAPPPEPQLQMVSPSGSELEMLEVVKAVGGLLSTLEEREVIRVVPRVVATSLKADITLLAVLDEEDQDLVGIVGGYDNIAQTGLPQAILDLVAHPSIVNALGRLRQTRLTPQRHQRELRDMYEKVGIMHEGPTYLQPLAHGEERLGVLIVGSPYSERLFSNEERNLLDRLSPLVTQALLNAESYQDLRYELDALTQSEGVRMASMTDELTVAKAELNAARQQIEEMKVYIRDMHRQMQSELTEQEQAEQQINQLLAEVERLREQARDANVLAERYQNLQHEHQAIVEEVAELRDRAEKAERLEKELDELREQARQRALEVARLEQERDRLTDDAALVGDLQRQIGALTERYNALKGQAERPIAALPAEQAPTAAPALERQLAELRTSSQMEIASLRTRLAEAAISQQEVVMLQEQLAVRAREIVKLKAQLAEAQATAETYREHLHGESDVAFTALDEQIEQQQAQIEQLRVELAEAREAVPDADQQTVEQIDREALTELEEQLQERNELVMRLERELDEKAKGLAEVRAYLVDIDQTVENLGAQLERKQTELAEAQQALAAARTAARQQLDELQAQLESGESDTEAVHQAEVASLRAELEEQTARYEAVEAELEDVQAVAERLASEAAESRKAATQAQQAEARNEVIASLTQELRTPMSSIMGYTELLLKESVGILGTAQRKFLKRVKANTERMNALLNDLIRITAYDSGRSDLEPVKVDAVYALEEAITQVANQYREKGVTLRMAITPSTLYLIADANAVVDIFGYLLGNAALASPVEGEVRLRLHPQRAEFKTGEDIVEADSVYFAVTDSGEGIDKDDMPRVFNRKYRADNPLIEGLGDTGVSLSLAKALVTAHDGDIWIDSEKGIGTTFHVLLPIEPLNSTQ
jgi:signal transduction histidine kinase